MRLQEWRCVAQGHTARKQQSLFPSPEPRSLHCITPLGHQPGHYPDQQWREMSVSKGQTGTTISREVPQGGENQASVSRMRKAPAGLTSGEGVWGLRQAFLPLGDQVTCRGKCQWPKTTGDDWGKPYPVRSQVQALRAPRTPPSKPNGLTGWNLLPKRREGPCIRQLLTSVNATRDPARVVVSAQ